MIIFPPQINKYNDSFVCSFMTIVSDANIRYVLCTVVYSAMGIVGTALCINLHQYLLGNNAIVNDIMLMKRNLLMQEPINLNWIFNLVIKWESLKPIGYYLFVTI